MLPTFNMTGKNVTPERQMAMMRTYLNELKDNTESELYDIKWENLSKPLREKIDSLDRYQVQNDEMMNYLSANMATISYLESNYIKASAITADYIAGKLIVGQQAHFASANVKDLFTAAVADIGFVKTSTLEADYATIDDLNSVNIKASQITAGTIAADRLSASTIVSVISNSDSATFSRLAVNVPPVGNGNSAFKFYINSSSTANVYLKAFEQGKYYLAVNLPY